MLATRPRASCPAPPSVRSDFPSAPADGYAPPLLVGRVVDTALTFGSSPSFFSSPNGCLLSLTAACMKGARSGASPAGKKCRSTGTSATMTRRTRGGYCPIGTSPRLCFAAACEEDNTTFRPCFPTGLFDVADDHTDNYSARPPASGACPTVPQRYRLGRKRTTHMTCDGRCMLTMDDEQSTTEEARSAVGRTGWRTCAGGRAIGRSGGRTVVRS